MQGELFFCGIDLGSTICKIVVINSGSQIVYTKMESIGGDLENILRDGIKQAIISLKIKKKQLRIIITGRNSDSIKKFKIKSELVCISEGTIVLEPNTKTIIDMGSFTSKIIRLKKGGVISDFLKNDVCSSGAGIFIELIVKSLDITLEELSQFALKAEKPISITSQCSIFAESEVIYLMNEGKSVPDIAAGVCNSVAGRLIPMALKLNPEPDIVFTGGVAKCNAIRKILEKKIGIQIKPTELDPQLITAFGAAILALKDKK